eukprot:Skav233692  [mRNA]  locus=scaffold1927:221139:230749:- [translate_table: standard]
MMPEKIFSGEWWRGNELGGLVNNPYYWSGTEIWPMSIGMGITEQHFFCAIEDWSLNNMNWLALSGAAPWSPPFFRVYHPVPKMDSSLNVKDPEARRENMGKQILLLFLLLLLRFILTTIFSPTTYANGVAKSFSSGAGPRVKFRQVTVQLGDGSGRFRKVPGEVQVPRGPGKFQEVVVQNKLLS